MTNNMYYFLTLLVFKQMTLYIYPTAFDVGSTSGCDLRPPGCK